jgi:hypothetical protein
MAASDLLSSRLQSLKDELVQSIPTKKAADRATLASKHLTDVIIQYLTWKARAVRPRPRRVIIWPEVTTSSHFAAHSADIPRIKAAFERGDDMNPYLSNLVRTNAYAGDLPTRTASMTDQEWLNKAWKGKDRIRVTVDTHHLHLGELRPDGTVDRTGPLLFAGISSDEAFFLAIGDHHSFNDGSISTLMHDKLDADLARSGGAAALAGPGITMAGTQVKDTFKSIGLVKKIKELDAAQPADRRFKLDWDDLVVVDASGKEVQRHGGLL